MKVVILVTHLLGTGHLARALTLARAIAQAGHDSIVVSGGLPAPHLDAGGVRLVQLPPLRSDGVAFTRLVDAAGQPADQALLRARQDRLRQLLQSDPPDVLITELFPFGRRVLSEEFMTALDVATALPKPPLICASIRDILAPPSKPAKAAATQDILTRFYAAVLVHADAGVTPLEQSWPVTPALAAKLTYTGFVAPPPPGPHLQGLGAGEVLVSAGGGDVGTDVFRTALAVAGTDPDRRWRLLVGGSDAPDRIAILQQAAPVNVTLEPARPDFRQMLHQAAASVSMAGYNTALDLLQSGTPAVLVPFDAGGETEQGLRAQALTRLPGIAMLKAADLTAASLRACLDEVIGAPARAPRTHGLDGAVQTVRLLEELLETRHAH